MTRTLKTLLVALGLMAAAGTAALADCPFHQAQAKAQQTAQSQDTTQTSTQ